MLLVSIFLLLLNVFEYGELADITLKIFNLIFY